jgi:hypothetical protein
MGTKRHGTMHEHYCRVQGPKAGFFGQLIPISTAANAHGSILAIHETQLNSTTHTINANDFSINIPSHGCYVTVQGAPHAW